MRSLRCPGAGGKHRCPAVRRAHGKAGGGRGGGQQGQTAPVARGGAPRLDRVRLAGCRRAQRSCHPDPCGYLRAPAQKGAAGHALRVFHRRSGGWGCVGPGAAGGGARAGERVVLVSSDRDVRERYERRGLPPVTAAAGTTVAPWAA